MDQPSESSDPAILGFINEDGAVEIDGKTIPPPPGFAWETNEEMKERLRDHTSNAPTIIVAGEKTGIRTLRKIVDGFPMTGAELGQSLVQEARSRTRKANEERVLSFVTMLTDHLQACFLQREKLDDEIGRFKDIIEQINRGLFHIQSDGRMTVEGFDVQNGFRRLDKK